MYSIINGLLDIDGQHTAFCCTKKAIKMNIRHQSGRPFSQLNYYFLFLYYYLITFLLLYIIILSNIILYTIIYFTAYYLPIWSIVFISNFVAFSLIISSFFLIKQFGKDIMCKCPEHERTE